MMALDHGRNAGVLSIDGGQNITRRHHVDAHRVWVTPFRHKLVQFGQQGTTGFEGNAHEAVSARSTVSHGWLGLAVSAIETSSGRHFFPGEC
jgi:hypothetical protein